MADTINPMDRRVTSKFNVQSGNPKGSAIIDTRSCITNDAAALTIIIRIIFVVLFLPESSYFICGS
jgi:hypothetical protein